MSSKPLKRKTKATGRVIASARELAATVGRSHTAIQKWLKRDDFPFSRSGPWQADEVPALLRWAADNLKSGGQDEKGTFPRGGGVTKDLRDEKLRQEIRKLRAQADQAETELERERGKLHDADACEEEQVRAFSLVRTAMQNLPAQLVSQAISDGLPHAAAPGFQRKAEEMIKGCLRHLAGQAESYGEKRNAQESDVVGVDGAEGGAGGT